MAEKTMDTIWMLNDQNRLLSRGGLVFRYSFIGKVEGLGELSPIKWEKLLPSGTFVEVAVSDAIRRLNDALQFRLAVLEDSKASNSGL